MKIAKIRDIASICNHTMGKPRARALHRRISFRSNGSQQRSICIFGACIEVGLTGFIGGPYCPRQGIFQTFCKFLLN